MCCLPRDVFFFYPLRVGVTSGTHYGRIMDLSEKTPISIFWTLVDKVYDAREDLPNVSANFQSLFTSVLVLKTFFYTVIAARNFFFFFLLFKTGTIGPVLYL